MSEIVDIPTETGSTPTEDERNRRSGTDIPGGDGGVSDEDIKSISDNITEDGGQTGEDHSTDVEGRDVVVPIGGGVQDANDRTSDIARIAD